MLKRVLNLLVYGGSTRLRDYERQLLELASGVLPERDRSVLNQQIEKLQRIKRYNDDRMVTFQFDGVDIPLLSEEAQEVVLVRYLVDARKSSKPLGALIAHRGRISSLEFKTKPAAIDAQTWQHVTATHKGADPQVARMIDREEHPDSVDRTDE